MSLKWDDSLVLGIEELDNQHKTIIDQYERLSEATQDGSSNEVIADLVNFLFEYAQVHFATEDSYMVKYGYPDIEKQRREHAEFTRDVDAFKKRIGQGGASRELAINIAGKLVRWIIMHIKSHDGVMFAYIKGQMRPSGR